MSDAEPRSSRAELAVTWSLLAVLVAWSAWQRWRLLDSSPFPLGIDGYFYPVQLRSLLESGGLQYPASPFAFYLLAPFAAATDPLTGAKLGAAILGALVAIPAYGVGARLGGSRGAGLLCAVLATTSAGSTYMTIEFVKNGIGMTVALAAVWAALAALDKPTRARIAVAVIALLAAILTHKMAAAFAACVIAPAVLASVSRRRRIYVAVAAAVLAAGVLVAGVVAPQRFLAPADLAQLRALTAGAVHWELPALVAPHQTLAMGHEALIAAVLAVLVAGALIVRRAAFGTPAMRAAAIALVVLALVVAIPWLDVDDPQGLGFRLRVASYVPMALLGALVARAAVGALPELLRTDAGTALALIAVVVALLAPRVADRADGRVITHPALASATLALVGQLPKGAELVVPERDLAFMAAWYTRAPVALRPDAFARAHRYRLLPLAFIGKGSLLDHALDDARREPALEAPLGLHARDPNGLVLVAEPTWEWAMTRLPARDRAYFAAWPTI